MPIWEEASAKFLLSGQMLLKVSYKALKQSSYIAKELIRDSLRGFPEVLHRGMHAGNSTVTEELMLLPHVTGLVYDSLPGLKLDETLPGRSASLCSLGLALSFTYVSWVNMNACSGLSNRVDEIIYTERINQ